MTKTYFLQRFSRLEPCQPWRGGRITDTDLLTLEEAAREACRHSGQEVCVNDFLRAADHGEITLRAIVHTSAKVEKFDGGIFCNQGEATENTVPKGAILTLPLVACQQLANVGSARWRTFDGFEIVDGDRCRFTVATLADGEPDFETVTADCRVIGVDVHALADAFVHLSANEQSPDEGLHIDEQGAPRPEDAAPTDNHEAVLAALFDPVRHPQLEKMFPDDGKWAGHAERAARNGLGGAKTGRGVFNPYLAARWWIDKGPAGWDWSRCAKVLARNLPARSIDSKYLLTGDYD